LCLIGLHLIAYPTGIPSNCAQREAQAIVISQLVAGMLAMDHSVIVLGDMNDYDNVTRDSSNNVPISKALAILRDPLPNVTGDELINAANLTEQENRYTSYYGTNCALLSSIDHILYSNDLAPYATGVTFDHSYAADCDSLESDHWPVILQLNTPVN